MSALQAFLERSLGTAGVIGVALLAGCLAFYGAGVRPAEAEAQALRDSLAGAARNAPDKRLRPGDTAETLARFYGAFRAPADALGALEAVFAAAAREQVAIDVGEYRVARERGARLNRYRIAFPVKGTYVAVRRFVARALHEVPGLALEDLSMRRERIDAQVVDARVQLTLYLGEGR